MRAIGRCSLRARACSRRRCARSGGTAVATIQQVVNLLLLRGNIGRLGTGAMPVRGHSNVQGDRTMGATSQVPDAWLDNIEATFPGVTVCRDAGRDAAGVIDGLF